jgi:hypothetical protein
VARSRKWVGPPENLKELTDVSSKEPNDDKIERREQRRAIKNRKRREKLVAPLVANEGEEKVVVEKEIQKMSLHAVREYKEQLLYSEDAKDRREAASYFLNAAGHGKKEATMGGAGSIIVITGIKPDQLPWQTVEGKVLDNGKPKAPQIPAGRVQSGTK